MSRVLKTGEPRITQGYSWRHHAVDLVKAPRDLDTITAHSGGLVVFCQTGQKNNQGSRGNASYGNCVKIDHGNGYYTLYAHMAKVYVKYGERVSQGQDIGYMGNTGNSYGAHLHFEVWKGNSRIDPTPYLNADLPYDKAKTEYAVHTLGGNWLDWVKGYNNINGNGYAGLPRKSIDGLKVRGHKYRVHVAGNGWLPWVYKADNTAEGYAGLYNKYIDGVQIEGVEYRVHLIQGGWLPWVKSYNDTADGYAGIYGKSIDKIQIK